MFLVDLEYFFLKLGGGFDEMLFSSYYGQENVELAIRVWVRPFPSSFSAYMYVHQRIEFFPAALWRRRGATIVLADRS